MDRPTDVRSCPKCGSTNFEFIEIVDNVDGNELHDKLECKCGCVYHLVFEYTGRKEIDKEETWRR